MSVRHVIACAFVAFIGLTANASAQGLRTAIRVLPNISYGGSIKAHTLDLYLPPKTKKPVPVVLWVHGGGWEMGDKLHPTAIFLVGRGYAVASINYRLSAEEAFPAQIHDCKAAVRWLRGNANKYNIDPERVGAWGSSAGGHLVALLGVSAGVSGLEGQVGKHSKESSRVQAVCDWCGPTDLERFARFRSSFPGLPEEYPMLAVAKLLRGSKAKPKFGLSMANPITFVTKKSPPFLIMHGDRDNLVPLEQSQLLADALEAAKSEVEMRVVEGGGHDIRGVPNIETVGRFFDRHLDTPDRAGDGSILKDASVIATFTHQAGNLRPFDMLFYSNGHLSSPEGPNTWVLWRNTLVLYGYDTRPAGGMWIDTCILSADGRMYTGNNQDGAQITGVTKPD